MQRGTQAPAVTPEMYKEVFEDHPTGRLVLDDLIRRFTRPAVTGSVSISGSTVTVDPGVTEFTLTITTTA